jgi:hypothetical protein
MAGAGEGVGAREALARTDGETDGEASARPHAARVVAVSRKMQYGLCGESAREERRARARARCGEA